jgi:NADH:ubiquinone oxidoreductase subunit 5 (subunit L)/multisubunit Na+/H+ antiporter MnhA subunit
MCETAPLFIEFYAQDYINYAALETFARLSVPVVVALVASAFCLGAYMYKIYTKRIER